MARIPKSTMKLPAFKQAAKEAFEEVHEDVPQSVIATGKTGKERTAMMAAISLSKAKAALKKKGG